jgi:putative flippase GtrA
MLISLLGFLNSLIIRISMLPVVRNWNWAPSFLRFSLVGVLNTVIDFSIYFSLTRFFSFFYIHFLVANFLAFFCANIFSYSVNKKWTFNNASKEYLRQYSKFLSVSLLSLLAIQLTLYICISWFSWYDVSAKILALLISVIINFVGARFWAFNN